MKRRMFAAIMVLAGLLIWPAPVRAMPLPEIAGPDIFLPHINPAVVDMMNTMKEVDIPDDNLRDALCDLLKIPYGDPVTRGDMADTPLQDAVELTGAGIKNLEGMQYAINMQSLELSGNPIQKVPEEMADLENLIYLGLSECGLTEVPENVLKMKQLKHLHLDGNQLAGLPLKLTEMEELIGLILDGNQLGALPDHIGSLTNLETLSASQNGIGSLPGSMKNCTKLKELYLMGNQLEEIPDWIGSLANLEVLVADGNEIRSLPGSMASLDAMKTLSVSFNRISRFPDFLSGMDSLDTLYLTANDIKELPIDLPDWPMSHIDLEWNDLDLEAPEIGTVLNGMETRGIHATVMPQKPVPELASDMSGEGIVKLGWPLISDTYSTMYTYTVAGLKLQRKTGDGDYATIAEMDAGATGYEDGDVEPDNTYTYKITARYKTDTGHFTYMTYRVAACDVSLAVAVATTQPTPRESPPPEETGQDVETVQTQGSDNRGLLIGLGVLLVLLLGVTVALVIVLAKRKRGTLPLPAVDNLMPAPPDVPGPAETGPGKTGDAKDTD